MKTPIRRGQRRTLTGTVQTVRTHTEGKRLVLLLVDDPTFPNRPDPPPEPNRPTILLEREEKC